MTEREKVVKKLEELLEQSRFNDSVGWNPDCDTETLEDALALLKAQEPVIRCEDCMYWKSDMLTHFWKPCDVVKTDKDWYCPCGKRR